MMSAANLWREDHPNAIFRHQVCHHIIMTNAALQMTSLNIIMTRSHHCDRVSHLLLLFDHYALFLDLGLELLDFDRLPVVTSEV